MRGKEGDIFEILGIILSVLISVTLFFSGIGKIFGVRIMREYFLHWGLIDLIQTVGFIEIVLAVLFLIPITWAISGFLLGGFFGGAIIVHLIFGSFQFALVPLLFLGMLLAAMFLRKPDIFS